MTTPNHDIAAWARGQLSDDELEALTGLSPRQAQYTADARAVWFADPMPADEPRHGEPPGWRDEHGTWHAPVCPGPEGCRGNGYDVPCDWWAAAQIEEGGEG